MTASYIDSKRRSLIKCCAALATAPFMGGAAQESVQPEDAERKAFIENAMSSLQDQARRESEAQEGRGAAAALSLATLVPFQDWDYYYVKGAPIYWRPNQGQSFKSVQVPEGFVTDLASIPRIFWQLLRPEGRHAYAAVVHDYLYWNQSRSKEEADLILKFALEDSKVDKVKTWAIYQAVDKLGQKAWDKNGQLKASGERRILKKFPSDLSIAWKEWKEVPGNLK